LFDLATGQPRVLHANHTDWVSSVSLTGDGKLAASGSKDKTAILWDVKAGKEVAEIKGYTQPVRVRFFPDGKTLATWAPNETKVRLWDTETAKEKTALGGHTGGISGVFFSPDGKTVAVPGNDGKVILWDVASLPE
jgi:WD40 repeat protein